MDQKKPPFHELSATAQFHTFPKLYGEYTEVSPANADLMELRFMTRKKVSKNLESNNNIESSYGIHFVNVINNVLKIEIPGDQDEARKLKRAKEKIKEYVHTLTQSIENYVRTIRILSESKRIFNKADIEESDNNRTRVHNQLISDIKILNRSLLWWFGEFDPELLRGQFQKMYETQEENYISHDFKRLDIPENGICPSSINLADRKQITEWAIKIYSDISLIDDKLS